ncbi:MAG: hypothetical protein WDN69_07030, partial [Aliidongia sp.]
GATPIRIRVRSSGWMDWKNALVGNPFAARGDIEPAQAGEAGVAVEPVLRDVPFPGSGRAGHRLRDEQPLLHIGELAEPAESWARISSAATSLDASDWVARKSSVFPVRPADRRDLQAVPEALATLADIQEVGADTLAGDQRRPDPIERRPIGFGRLQKPAVAPDDLFGRIPDQPAERVIGIKHDAIIRDAIRHRHRNARLAYGFEQSSIEQQSIAQRRAERMQSFKHCF